MATPEFQNAKCDATSTGEYSSDVSTTGDRTTITSVRVLPTDGLPDIAKSFVGPSLTISEVQTWGPPAADGSRTADLQLHVKGAPMTMRGTIRLSPNGSGSLHTVDGDVKVRVPLIGGKLEKAASEPLMHAARTETGLLRERVS